ncbi:hypothetical protein F53441_1067 [Fusarium austroafricanum]|uniref:NACHT domain-containing protein n=1 Tax=Fusarium austroafricanum TaxID=2364996 RepID=A0A8H4P5H3_9HYPO|nr:hypothetical protein F53441_1067 [Fusarium austroafricanum]
MDPLTAISLVANIITFVDFGFKVVNDAGEIKESASGTTAENEHLNFLTTQIQGHTQALQMYVPVSTSNSDEQRLDELIRECQSLSGDLLKLLQTLQVNNSSKKSKRESISAAFRNFRKKDEKNDLLARLGRCQEQLHLQISHIDRQDTRTKLASIIKSGKCHDFELEKLSQQVETLQNGVQVTNLGPELLADIRRLLNLTDEAMSKVLQTTILNALEQDKMGERYDAVETAYEKTFDWLLDEEDQYSSARPNPREVNQKRQSARKEFVDWLSSGGGIFHISGKPGAGKSTLMKYICESDRALQLLNEWAGAKRLVFAKFFFWRYGTDVQKSWNGLVRSLLLSIVSECPQLIESIFLKQWKSARSSLPCHFSAVDIDNAFTDLMKRNDVFEKHKFAFVIDGLDEFVGRDDILIASLFCWVNAWPTDIKICVSSRELPIFQQRFFDCPKFRVHELTKPDMQIMARDALEKNQDFNAIAGSARLELTSLIDTLVNRAEGVFLWLTLALKTLEQGLLLEDSVNDLKKKITSLPKEVEDLFSAIFETIMTELHPLDRERALRILGFVTALEPYYANLTHFEAAFLDDYGDDKNFAEIMDDAVDFEERQNRLRRGRKQIEGRCRGLLSIVEYPWPGKFGIKYGDIKFTHRSLVEYFRRPDVVANLEPYSDPVDISSFKFQAVLAELKCAAPYLMKSKLDRRSKGGDQNNSCQAEDEAVDEPPSTPEDISKAAGNFERRVSDLCNALYWSGQLPTSLVMRMLQPLNLVAERLLDHPPFDDLEICFEVNDRDMLSPLVIPVKSRASFCCPLRAASLGASPRDPVIQPRFSWDSSTTLWQLAVWTLFTKWCDLLPEPFLLAFIIYGAETSVELEFDLAPEEGGVFVKCVFGAEREVPFKRMLLEPGVIENIKLFELAKESGWSLSFRQILQFWCPSNMHKFDKLEELRAGHGGMGTEIHDIEYLKRLCGLDVENWNEAEWVMPGRLLTPMPLRRSS